MKNQEARKPASDQQYDPKEKNKQTAQNTQQSKESKDQQQSKDQEQKINDQVTGKTHQGNNDSAPVHPGGEHKISAWVEAQPDNKDQ